MVAGRDDGNEGCGGIADFPRLLSKVLNGKAGVTAGMALRLSAWLGTSPDVWLWMQTQWNLWQAEQLPKPNIRPMEKVAA